VSQCDIIHADLLLKKEARILAESYEKNFMDILMDKTLVNTQLV